MMDNIITFEMTERLNEPTADENIADEKVIPPFKADSNNDIYRALRALVDITPLAYAEDHNGALLEVRAAYPDEFIAVQPGGPQNPVSQFVDTITYQIVRREPATLQDAPFQPRKDIKPRFREMKSVDGKSAVEIKGQWFDNLVQFDCWTRSNSEADDLMEWFEEFMILYTFYFKKYVGIQEMLYYRGGRFTFGTTEEEAMVRWRNPYKVRSCTYYFRTEKLWFLDYSKIQKIIVRLEVQGRY